MQLDNTLRERLRHQLAGFELQRAAPGSAKAAAVALAITDEGLGAALEGLPQHAAWQDRAAMVLTRRSLQLRSHPGQWALPGGRIDPGESAEQTALRELHEEVGLRLDASAVLGRLDDFVTRSGFVMTPVVVWAGPQPLLQPNPAEVASIHRIPLTEFLREDAQMLEVGEPGGAPVLRLRVGSSWIAAPTAALLLQFSELCLLGRPTRVGHFDQPGFAWR